MALVNHFFSKKIQTYAGFSLILAGAFFFFFYGLGSYGLLNNNEGLYAHISRDMASLLLTDFSLKGWVIPQINGFPYIEKPPLLYWLTALSFHIFGINEFAARFFPAFSGVILVGWVSYFFSRLQKPSCTFPSLMILLSSLGYVIFSRMVFFEGLLTCLCSLSFLEFYLWYKQEKSMDLYLFYIFLGLSCLTKGFAPPCLVGLVIVSFFIWDKTSWKKMLHFFNPLGIILFFLMFLPWLICAGLYEKEFFWFYIINEHVLRFMGQRLPKDYYSGPFYYYIPRIFGYLFPWSFFCGLFFLKTPPLHEAEKSFRRFLCLWVIVPFLFFSLSQAKANYYMIMAMVPLAILLGSKLSLIQSSPRKGYIGFFTSLTTLLVLCLLLTPFFVSVSYLTFSPCLFFLSLLLVVFFEAISRLKTKWQHLTPLLQIVSLAAVLLVWILHGMSSLQHKALISSKGLATQLLSYKNQPLFFYRHYEELSALPFYLPFPFYMLDSQSADLDFAHHHPSSRDRFLESKNLAPGLLKANPLIVVHRKSLGDFYGTFLGKFFYPLLEEDGVTVFAPKEFRPIVS